MQPTFVAVRELSSSLDRLARQWEKVSVRSWLVNTPEEDRYDEWLGELYEEHAEQAICDFKVERLRSFYLQHPEAAAGPHRALCEGRALLVEHPTASFIFSAIAIETLLKGTLLRPIVYGLVHDEAAAHLVVEVALAGRGVSRYAKLLIQIV